MSDMHLFPSEYKSPIILDLPHSDISYFPSFYSLDESEYYLKILHKETSWQQDYIKLFGKTYAQPRLTALYGNEGKPYSYSGIKMEATPFTESLNDIKKKVESLTEENFNSVLLNLYRDGKDSNGWHSDNEKELGKNPTIASISFGAERPFHLRHKRENLKFKLVLEPGSLLLMKGPTQEYWQHQIPKSKRNFEKRINLTFRLIS